MKMMRSGPSYEGHREFSMMQRLLKLIGTVGATIALGGSLAAHADTIKIGAFGPFSGDAAANGEHMRQGIDLAVKDKNAAGGIRGEQIEVIYGDDAGKPEEAVSVAKRLISRDGVVLTLGSFSSPASLAASQVSAQLKVPQIVIAGTAQKITTSGNQWVFRTPVADTKLVSDLVDFIHEKMPNAKRFGFLYVNDDFGRGGFEAFKKAAERYHFEIVDEERFTRGDIDFTAQLSKIEAAKPDAIIEWSRYSESALIAKQLKQMNNTIPMVGSDGLATSKFVELGGDAVNGTYYATHWSVATSKDIPAAQAFVAEFEKTYKAQPLADNAEGYDAAMIALAAIERAGSNDPTAIRDALRKTDYASVRGPFKFDANGDPELRTHVARIVDGKEVNGRESTAN
jgi:branched-chain amino acid transport system substrate-binding protein